MKASFKKIVSIILKRQAQRRGACIKRRRTQGNEDRIHNMIKECMAQIGKDISLRDDKTIANKTGLYISILLIKFYLEQIGRPHL